MNVWMVRSDRHGEQENTALEQGLACINYSQVQDLSAAKTREAARAIIAETFPDASDGKVNNLTNQAFAFSQRMQEGDIVAMPLKSQPQVALGKVTGPYQYRTDLGDIHHTRKVQWIRPDVPRTKIKQDLLFSLGAFMTVCQIKRNNAVQRIQALLKGHPDPGFSPPNEADANDTEVEAEETLRDVEIIARDQVRAFIEKRFKGHDLSRLVEAILKAEGYVTLNAPPGPDGGVDILARRGTLGFDGPKLCVQVKSSNASADVTIFRGLQGSMVTFKAEEGLLVSWGGFNHIVTKEARLSFFSVRLWDADDLIAAVQRNYEKLPKELQNELPLKRIWTLVPEE